MSGSSAASPVAHRARASMPLQLGKGIREDLQARLPWYVSDWKEGFESGYRCALRELLVPCKQCPKASQLKVPVTSAHMRPPCSSPRDAAPHPSRASTGTSASTAALHQQATSPWPCATGTRARTPPDAARTVLQHLCAVGVHLLRVSHPRARVWRADRAPHARPVQWRPRAALRRHCGRRTGALLPRTRAHMCQRHAPTPARLRVAYTGACCAGALASLHTPVRPCCGVDEA